MRGGGWGHAAPVKRERAKNINARFLFLLMSERNERVWIFFSFDPKKQFPTLLFFFSAVISARTALIGPTRRFGAAVPFDFHFFLFNRARWLDCGEELSVSVFFFLPRVQARAFFLFNFFPVVCVRRDNLLSQKKNQTKLRPGGPVVSHKKQKSKQAKNIRKESAAHTAGVELCFGLDVQESMQVVCACVLCVGGEKSKLGLKIFSGKRM